MKFTKNNYLRKTKLMNQLIKITEENGQRAISARELHLFLVVGRDFSNWIKGQIEEYGFIENQDLFFAPPFWGANRQRRT